MFLSSENQRRFVHWAGLAYYLKVIHARVRQLEYNSLSAIGNFPVKAVLNTEGLRFGFPRSSGIC